MDRAHLLLKHWLDTNSLGRDGRLPPERALAVEFGVTRAELRKALALLEADGRLVRHVGRGTFLVRGGRTTDGSVPAGREESPAPSSALADATSPRQVFEAALAIEPALTRLAAVNGTSAQLRAVTATAGAVAEAGTWERYDTADAAFHRAIAEAAGNPVLLALHDTVAGTRASLAWGTLRDRGDAPAANHPTIADHAAIATAVAARDQQAACDAARHHVLVEAAAILGPWI